MNWMKNGVSWLMIAIIIVLSCMSNCQNKRAKEAKKLSDTMENSLSLINQKAEVTTVQLRDSLAIKQAEVEKLQVTNQNLQSLYGDLLKSTKTKPKDVKELTSICTATSGVDTVICEVDSFKGLKAHWVDNYINIRVDIDSARRAAIDYNIKDSLTVISYQKKHSILFGLIKWNSYEGCKVITHNPKSTPVTVVSYTNVKH